MTNAEMENTLSRMCSELSVMRRQLAGVPESYTDGALIAVDDRIGYAQLAMQSACLLLGSGPDLLEPDVESAMSPLVGIV